MAKVLIVEDDAVALAVLKKILSESNEFETISAENGMQALAALEMHSDISAILLDRNMPEMGGMEALEKIKQNPDWARIPVIFQTGDDKDADVIEGTQAGAYYYLKKPYEPALVRTIVRSAVEDKAA